jgi:hypothetical protein
LTAPGRGDAPWKIFGGDKPAKIRAENASLFNTLPSSPPSFSKIIFGRIKQYQRLAREKTWRRRLAATA